MRVRVSISHALSLALLLLLSAAQASAQGSWTLRLRGQDGAGGIDTLLFGRDPRATYCIDPFTFYEGPRGFQEFELPPAPPTGVFDFRMGNHRPGLGGCITATERGNGLRYDIRPSSPPGGIDTFTVRYQIGASGPITLTWPADLNVFVDSARLRDVFTGTIVNINMLGQQSFVVTNPALTSLSAILYGTPGPALSSPASGSTVPPTVTLEWSTVTNATKYRLQVATDSTFDQASLLVHDSTLTGGSREVTGLSSPATFYWRVAAGTATGWAAYSPVWVFRTGSVPAAPAPLEPADGATNQPSSVFFRWTSVAEATAYQLQIATDSTFSSGIAVNDSSIADSSTTVNGLAFGTTFYWRVAARNDVGRSPFSVRRAFTTQLQPPPAPTLVAPANGQTNVPVSTTLSWSVGGGGSGLTYRVQVATDASFTGVVLDDSTVTVTTRDVGPLQTSTQYFWKITAKNQAGYGPSSAVWSFTTAPPLPAAPVLQAPADGATNVLLTPTLQWGAAAGATTYRLQVATDTGFAARIVDDSTITGTTRQIGPLAINTVYYWRVRGKNAAGSGPYSSRFRFTSSAAPPVPQQSSPPDQAVRVDRNARFVWSPVPGATGYHLQVATEAAFTTLLVNDSTITDTARIAGPLPYGARLWWRIRSRNTAGRSEFSPGWSFTVQLQPPAQTVQLTPANNATGQPVPVTLRWQAASLAWWYQVHIALDTLMTNIVLSDSAIADTARSFRVAPNTAYYWRVRGINTEGTAGVWSTIRRLTTGNVPPATPLPFHPANNDTNVSRTPMLRWTASPGALTYRVQVARDNLFTQIVADDSLVVANQYQPGLLQPQTPYYWRVRARGTAGYSAYSVIQRFTTGSLIVAVEDDGGSGVPGAFALLQNYPNPFNPSTTVQYVVAEQADVALTVYSLLGQEVVRLVDGVHAPGTHTAVWHGADAQGRPVPSGIYLVRMTATGAGAPFSALRKMILMK